LTLGVKFFIPLEYFSSAVVRLAIGDEDFKALGWVILAQDGIQAPLDVGCFVADGDEDGDEGKTFTNH
jgi:hypothetical protein